MWRHGKCADNIRKSRSIENRLPRQQSRQGGEYFHQPDRRSDKEGLSGAFALDTLVSTSARTPLLVVLVLGLRVKLKPRGSVMGVSSAPADEEDSESESGYEAPSLAPAPLVRLRRP